jgi:hypothetical protein
VSYVCLFSTRGEISTSTSAMTKSRSHAWKWLKKRRGSRTCFSLLLQYRVCLRDYVVHGMTCQLSTIWWNTRPALQGRRRALSVQRELGVLRELRRRCVGSLASKFIKIVGQRSTALLCYLPRGKATEVGAWRKAVGSLD